MKTYLHLLLAMLLVAALVSCNKDNPKKKSPAPKVDVPDAIDLGTIVNGKNVKWASYNLGATKPVELGNYYAWGETEPKTAYTWDTYEHGAQGALTAYCPATESGNTYWDMTNKPNGPDDERVLAPGDDPVAATYGGKWRMPTVDDFDALLSCLGNDDYIWEDWALVKNEETDESFHCIRITRKSTNAQLIIPAAGLYYDDSGAPKQVDYYAYYWSSSLYKSNPNYAWGLSFHSGTASTITSNRCNGFTIRGVTE